MGKVGDREERLNIGEQRTRRERERGMTVKIERFAFNVISQYCENL